MNFAELFKYLIPIKFIRLNIISEVIGRFPQIITIAIQQHIKWLTDIPSQCFKIEIPNIYYLKSLWGEFQDEFQQHTNTPEKTHEILATDCLGDGCNLLTIHSLRMILTGLSVFSTEW